jgi:hypothetical protein
MRKILSLETFFACVSRKFSQKVNIFTMNSHVFPSTTIVVSTEKNLFDASIRQKAHDVESFKIANIVRGFCVLLSNVFLFFLFAILISLIRVRERIRLSKLNFSLLALDALLVFEDNTQEMNEKTAVVFCVLSQSLK